jgi:hypothetical protein
MSAACALADAGFRVHPSRTPQLSRRTRLFLSPSRHTAKSSITASTCSSAAAPTSSPSTSASASPTKSTGQPHDHDRAGRPPQQLGRPRCPRRMHGCRHPQGKLLLAADKLSLIYAPSPRSCCSKSDPSRSLADWLAPLTTRPPAPSSASGVSSSPAPSTPTSTKSPCPTPPRSSASSS